LWCTFVLKLNHETMRSIKIQLFFVALSLMVACGGDKSKTTSDTTPAPSAIPEASTTDYDPKRGEGKFNAENVVVDAQLNKTMADEGEKAAGVKCISCHKLTDERLVGPGWKGVTTRHTPAWLMNFITNPDPMIDKDPALKAQLEICLVRMPNQNLAEVEARNIVEYMRKIDGVK
jgi:mono/diheme cytochrome c family protein